nr:DHA2 family efflux MFS transporter permease subunit [Streptomyces sp. SID5468]
MVVVVGSLMSVLDTTIVNVALAPLARDFAAPLTVIQWVATAYTLALATVVPATGWSVARFGTKRLYTLAICLFTAGSVLAGLAWDVRALIAFRVVQGLGGGLIMPVGMTMVVRAADKASMGRTMALLGIPVLIGPMAGPVLGGWLLDHADWRWMFFVNVPLGVVAAFLAVRVLPRDPAGTATAPRLDVPGLLTLSPGLVALLYGLTVAGRERSPAAPGALVPMALGAALIAVFTVRALTVRQPLVDLRLFGRRTFAAGAGVMALFPCAYFGSMLLTPMYYQVVRGVSATTAGLLGIPQVLATGLMMQVAGGLVDRAAPGRVVVTGVLTASAGFLAFTLQVGAGTPFPRLVAALAVMGVGVGMTMMPAQTAATRELSHAQVPQAMATIGITGQIAASVGGVVMSVLLTGAMTARGVTTDDHTAADAPRLADAFQHTYGWAVALMALAVLPALLLPARRTRRDG